MWAKDVKIGSKMINARSETLAGKGAFKPAFTKRRCIVPADGFFEWKDLGTPAGAKKALKQPMFIHRLDGEPLAFAGLWETWRDRNVEAAADAAAAEILRTTTIITTAANATMAPVHDRMPVILPASAWDEWLDPSNHDLTRLGRLLVPAPDGLLTMHPVSTAVNSVRNRGPELLEPVEPLAPATAAIGPPAPPESELPL